VTILLQQAIYYYNYFKLSSETHFQNDYIDLIIIFIDSPVDYRATCCEIPCTEYKARGAVPQSTTTCDNYLVAILLLLLHQEEEEEVVLLRQTLHLS
jgi:hypothetical protein